MLQYYAAPITRTKRGMYVNPLAGECVLANSPHSAHIGLGQPEPGSLFAVWIFGHVASPERPEYTLEEAGYLCSRIPPAKVYVCLDEDTIVPLDVNPVLDVLVEV
jgi:hypothetical protein